MPCARSGGPWANPVDHASALATCKETKGYDAGYLRRALWARGIIPRIARRGVESSERLGRHRWVVERSQGWLVTLRKLATRYDPRPPRCWDCCNLACAVICLRYLAHAEATQP